MKQLFAAILFILFVGLALASNPVSVPLGDPIYRFLDRMETIGILDNLRDGIKPFERGRISQLLIQVNEERT